HIVCILWPNAYSVTACRRNTTAPKTTNQGIFCLGIRQDWWRKGKSDTRKSIIKGTKTKGYQGDKRCTR
ncbi:MAG: hypothetical protein V1749_08295, partial [Candidatus Desantisbacteria bacterium]